MHRDVQRLNKATEGSQPVDASFMTAASPGVVALFQVKSIYLAPAGAQRVYISNLYLSIQITFKAVFRWLSKILLFVKSLIHRTVYFKLISPSYPFYRPINSTRLMRNMLGL